MPRVQIYDHLLEPIGTRLQRDTRFARINIFYDRDDDEIVASTLMPAINYFLQPDWEDETRGSNTASLQDRRIRATIGFNLWAYDPDRARLDKVLFDISGNLIDWLRESTDFDRTNGVAVVGNIRWTPVAAHVEDNNVVGVQRVVADFELYIGAGI